MEKENFQKTTDDKESKITDPELLKVNTNNFRSKERKRKRKKNNQSLTLKPKKNKKKNNQLKNQKKKLTMILKCNIISLMLN
jgi:hypothetical protein